MNCLILEVHDSQEVEEDNKSDNSKFRVLNEINQGENILKSNNLIKEPVPEEVNNDYVIPKPQKKSANEVFNIYSFYSNDDPSTMHKLRVKTATADWPHLIQIIPSSPYFSIVIIVYITVSWL